MSVKIKSLDGLRAIAVFLVVISHAVGLYYPSYEKSLGVLSQLGVWLFFVLSAYLLTNRFFVTGFSIRSLVSYVLGRALRIIPAFSLAVYVYHLLGFFDEETMYRAILMQEMVMHLWTIPIEFKFYFALPFIAFVAIYLHKKYDFIGSVSFLIVTVICFQFLYPYTNLGYGGMVFWFYPLFASGMIAACVYQHLCAKKIKLSHLSDIIFVLFIVAIASVLPYVTNVLFEIDNGAWAINKFLFYAPIFACTILAMSYCGGIAQRVLSTNVFSYIGKWSFSIYLWHLIILYRTIHIVGVGIYSFVLSLLLSIVFGGIGFYLIENPMEKLRHKIMSYIISKKKETPQSAI